MWLSTTWAPRSCASSSARFVAAILDGDDLLAPASEGIHSVEMANAMIYSSLRGETVHLPLDGAAYAGLLDQLISGELDAKTA
jgi:hypothetical protein